MGHEHAYLICENKCKVEGVPKTKYDEDMQELQGNVSHRKEFTYVVNSDASLEYWLTNKASGTSSGGDDFTSVLIKKGTWTFEGETVALDTIGTLYVEGEAGSKLAVSNTTYALWYNSINNESSMFNVTAVLNSDISLSSCFYLCHNLTNCTGEMESTSTANGFNKCDSLFGCRGKGNGNGGGGFINCNYLVNCTGVAFGTSSSKTANGFSGCHNLVNCIGSGNNPNGTGYGFAECTVVHGCKAGGFCSTSVFNSRCYASYASSNDYKCADTPAGGFNNTTNPSA